MKKIIFCIISESEQPKSMEHFSKMNAHIELASKISFVGLIKVSLKFMILPKCLISIGVYVFTDSGSDSFELPIPMW